MELKQALAMYESTTGHHADLPALREQVVAKLKPQKTLMKGVHVTNHEILMESLPLEGQARLRGYGMEHANDWARCAPVRPLGCRFDSSSYSNSVNRLLGQRLLEQPGICKLCGQVMDVYGLHAAVCHAGKSALFEAGPVERHNELRDVICHGARGAGLSASLEVLGLLPGGGERPADVLVRGLSRGYDQSALDITIEATLQKSTLVMAAKQTGYVALRGFTRKLDRFDALAERGIKIIPLAWETTGGAHPMVHTIINDFAKLEAGRTGNNAKRLANQTFAKISCSLQRTLSRAFLARRPVALPSSDF